MTEKGFVLKRMDTILEEIHTDLTEGFGVNTRLSESSFLNVLVVTFAGQIADLWETAQDSYYAKYPATATGINLDHAVQYGGIRRAPNKRTCFPLHCTGEDGSYVRANAVVASNTKPEISFYAAEEFQITRENFNEVCVKVASVQSNGMYTIAINGSQYHYFNVDGGEVEILEGLRAAITDVEYMVAVEAKTNVLVIQDTVKSRGNGLILSDNLTTSRVTTIANFLSKEYGKITLPFGVITKIGNHITGFHAVTNLLEPIYGRIAETDIELRQSYLAKSALRSNTMMDSIIAELLNNVTNVESASGYENDTDVVDKRGLPPHSIEILVEGGKESEIAAAILRRKAGGIQTYGKILVNVPGNYGEAIPIRFNRPEYFYTWMKIKLYGNKSQLPLNYVSLVMESILENGAQLKAGSPLLTQLFHEGIYRAVAGITYIEIWTAYATEISYVPVEEDYQRKNVMVTSRQKVLLDQTRMEVTFFADS